MATKFSPCKGSYVLNQFPSNVMFGMNGFHVSASGAIQGHHGPLVFVTEAHAGSPKNHYQLVNKGIYQVHTLLILNHNKDNYTDTSVNIYLPFSKSFTICNALPYRNRLIQHSALTR